MRSIIVSLILVHVSAASISSTSSSSSSSSGSVNRDHGMSSHGDELILSGDNGGCWDDDECQAYPPENGSGSDDLITPRIVVLEPRPSYSPINPGRRTSSSSSSSSSACVDDEDCPFEGSGDGDGESDNRNRNRESSKPIVPQVTIWEDDKSIMYTSKPIPPPDLPVPSVMPRPRPTAPRPTGPRVIIDVPKPMIPTRESSGNSNSESKESSRNNKSRNKVHVTSTTTTTTSFNKSSADRTALVIGLVAFILIIIVIVAPFIVFCKIKLKSGSGKMMGTGGALNDPSGRNLNYAFVPQPSNQQQQQLVNSHPGVMMPQGSISIGHNLNSNSQNVPLLVAQQGQLDPFGTMRGQINKKDPKEWYV